MSEQKSIHIRKRGTTQEHRITPGAWAKMQKNGKAEFYELIAPPTMPKEVAAKVATHKKMSPDKTGESDNNGLQEDFDRLPVENAG